MIRSRLAVLTAIVLLANLTPTFAQPVGPATGVIPERRPKVCLVLSGGGARGAAHIGVLKVLEEYRVPIDCITGTSMGALVGAGYASGMTVAEMTTMIEQLSFDVLFKEQPPREERSIRRKQDEGRNLFGPQIGVTDELDFRFQKGFVSGVRLETVLRRISRVKGHIDFDSLPIPFRAVATDLVTGKPKVFREGNLALVMRASMSVPGVIAPAEFDGMVLVDGGLVNNIPVDLARELGADIVIAVNLGTSLMKRDEIKDVRGVAAQMFNILTEQNVQATLASLKDTDVLILPELGDFSAAEFDQLKKTLPIGEAATRKVADRLAKLSVSAERFAAYQAHRTTPLVADTRPIDEIRFESMRRVRPEYAGTILDTQPGQPIDQAKLDADLLRLYGTDDFEHVSYRLIDSPARRILNIEAVEKSWGPNYARIGLGLSSDFSGRAYFNLLGQYRRTWMNELGGESRTDLSLGRNTSLDTELYQPLEPRHRFFVVPRLHAERYYLEVFDQRHAIAEYSFPTVIAGVDVGAQYARFGEIRVGVFGGITKGKLNTGEEVFPVSGTTTLGGVRLRGYVDQLDSAYFPKRGFAVDVSLLKGLKALGSETDYDQWDANVLAAHTVGRHTVQGGFRGAGPISGSEGANYTTVPWGGFLQQSGFATGQLLNERFTFGRLLYVYKLRDLPLLEGLYAGVSAEIGDYGRPLLAGNPSGVLYSGSAFLALDSPIGPVYLGYGVGSQGNRSAYFFLGRP
jgi:NTE family protein